MDIGRGNVGRSHTQQIYGSCNIRGKFLPNRTATTNVVNAVTVNVFKSRLDAHMAAGNLRRSVYQV